MTGRHPSTAVFDEYLGCGVPVELPVEGDPHLSLFIDPDRPAIGIRMPADAAADLAESGWRNISLRRVYRDGRRQAEIYVDDERLFTEAYPVLLSIADRMQLDGRSLEDALAYTMRLLGQLLLRPTTLTVEREIGLLGELTLLRGLCGTLGSRAALDSWTGPVGGEHDFVLPGLDLEVKTTSTERRRHLIGSAEQLRASPGRPLLLVSYQLTKVGHGGRTLPELIAEIRNSLVPAERPAFDARLEAAEWAQNPEAYPTRWRK